MLQALTLAQRGGNQVGANPLVGAIIVYKDKILGSGYHAKYGEAHAEVNALNKVAQADLKYLAKAELYVTLEPCNHHGKTPPCTEAIIKSAIRKVTICNLDPNSLMQGKSIDYLRSKGIQVRTGLHQKKGAIVNRKFFINHQEQLPFIVLKWAQSADFFMGQKEKQVWISNETSKLAVHKWRGALDGILVGTNTALTDDPQLTNRLSTGGHPMRILLDRTRKLPYSSQLLSDEFPTLIFTTQQDNNLLGSNKDIIEIHEEEWDLRNIFSTLLKKGITSVLVEGGKKILNSCISEGLWHEARVIRSPKKLGSGIKCPNLKGKLIDKIDLNGDKLFIVKRLH